MPIRPLARWSPNRSPRRLCSRTRPGRSQRVGLHPTRRPVNRRRSGAHRRERRRARAPPSRRRLLGRAGARGASDAITASVSLSGRACPHPVDQRDRTPSVPHSCGGGIRRDQAGCGRVGRALANRRDAAVARGGRIPGRHQPCTWAWQGASSGAAGRGNAGIGPARCRGCRAFAVGRPRRSRERGEHGWLCPRWHPRRQPASRGSRWRVRRRLGRWLLRGPRGNPARARQDRHLARLKSQRGQTRHDQTRSSSR